MAAYPYDFQEGGQWRAKQPAESNRRIIWLVTEFLLFLKGADLDSFKAQISKLGEQIKVSLRHQFDVVMVEHALIDTQICPQRAALEARLRTLYT